MRHRKPDYKLKILNKRTGIKYATVAAGWKNADGSIGIMLNPCVVLQQHEDKVLTLFPSDSEEGKEV